MKANKYFDIKELVPKEVYEELGEEKSLALLDSRALKALEEVREILGIPLICNNWASGGSIVDTDSQIVKSELKIRNIKKVMLLI